VHERDIQVSLSLEVNIHEFETRLWCVQTALCSTRGLGYKGN